MSRRRAWIVAFALGAWPGIALAQPFRGRGEAKVEADAKGEQSPATLRTKALDRARRSALEAALGELGKIDKATRKAVLGKSAAWTGSYRVIDEQGTADAVSLEIEVEIDLERLRKRATGAPPSVGTKPRYTLGEVELGAGCDPDATVRARVEDEIIVSGAVGKSGTRLDMAITCTSLGAVPHTFEHAARVEVIGKSQGRTVSQARVDGFARSPEDAMVAAVADATIEVASALARQPSGRVLVRVVGVRPAIKLRRFERALSQSVAGVTRVELVRVDAHSAVLTVHGPSDASALAAAISTLTMPSATPTVAAVEGPDVLAVELR